MGEKNRRLAFLRSKRAQALFTSGGSWGDAVKQARAEITDAGPGFRPTKTAAPHKYPTEYPRRFMRHAGAGRRGRIARRKARGVR